MVMEIGRQGALARGGSGNRRGGSTAEAMRIWLISNSQTRRNRYISRRFLSIGDYPADIARRTPTRSFLASRSFTVRARTSFTPPSCAFYYIYILYTCVRGDVDRERERVVCSSSPPGLRTVAEKINFRFAAIYNFL